MHPTELESINTTSLTLKDVRTSTGGPAPTKASGMCLMFYLSHLSRVLVIGSTPGVTSAMQSYGCVHTDNRAKV